MKQQKLKFWSGLALGLAMAASSFTVQATSDTPLSLSSAPLFLVNQVKPSVMVMLDNSGSMKNRMYTGSYDNTQDFYGIFDGVKTYEYDSSIPVDTTAYSVPIDTNVAGAFKESTCTLGSGGNCWSGNFLNWVTTRRIDATRMVLVGGKVENRTGVAYGAYGSGTEYKILGNNERSDGSFNKSSSNSSQSSPISDSRTMNVNSPANSGNVKTVYDPYEKISIAGGAEGFIYDSGGAEIDEYGSASARTTIDGTTGYPDTTSWAQVNFRRSYSSAPVIIAKPPTRNGADPGLVRIRNVSASGFEIAFQEWDYKDGNHTGEDLPYIVLEAGTHTMPGGGKMEAGLTTTHEMYQTRCTGSDKSDSDTINFTQVFSSKPVVVTSVVSYNDKAAVNSRVREISTTRFKLSLQEQEDGGDHSDEAVAYVAIETMRVDDSSLPFFLEVGKKNNVDDGNATVNFTASFPSAPVFIAGIQTIDGEDPAVLRTRSVDTGSAAIALEEEKSCDTETGHTDEDIGYIALAGGGDSDYNVAVVVSSVKQGVLQKVQGDVRMGISFYRYDPDRNDIYNGNTIPGGTLNFKIPLNPFVKQASVDGYRELSGYIGTPIDEVIDALEHYPLVWGTTPLAENLWEVFQYFEQDNPYYTAVTSGFEDFDLADTTNPERDPFYDPDYGELMECANSNVLIFTDGEPYKDADLPAIVLDYDGGGNTFADCTDGSNRDFDCVDPAPNAWGHDNLDDVAYWGFCNKTLGSCINTTTGLAENPNRDLRTDLAGDQYIRVDTVGFANGAISQILDDTSDNGGGTAYAAEDGGALATTLVTAFTDIASGSAASVAVTSGSLQTNSKLYLARFNSNDWSGDLLAFAINPDGSLENTIDSNDLMQPGSNGWQASNQIPAAGSRVIFSHNGASGASQAGIPFQFASLNGTQQGLLGSVEILNWLRGDQSEESLTSGSTLNLRDRTATVLGDVIHSSPAYVAAPAFQYPDDMEGSVAADRYSTFKAAQLSRTPMIYTGANDGMLHAFDANTGIEKFAYVPNAVYSRLAGLSDPNYTHQYTVDGAPIVVDAYLDTTKKWRTILAAGLRGGGQGVYALDVTDPASVTNEVTGAAKVLWEFTDADDADLGYTYSEPNIVRLHNGDWAAIFGNGYNNTEPDSNASTTGNAVLYIVRLKDGSLIKKIDTGVGYSDPASGNRPNGLATAAPTDIDGDAIADYVYAGDLYGNMWKFDLTSSNVSSWGVSYGTPSTPEPMYTACAGDPCSNTNRQPITVRPQVSEHPTEDGFLVYFGTGQYIEDSDNIVAGQLTQSFYGIWDENQASLSAFDRGDLRERKILLEVSAGIFDLRITSGIPDDTADGGGNIDWPNEKGWYMDLIVDGESDNKGERVVFNPIFRQGRIIFTTLIPSEDPCAYGGSGWLMELDAYEGTRLSETPFDVNGDGVFNIDDYGTVDWDINGDGSTDGGDKAPPSGVRMDGIPTSPGITANKDNTKEFKYMAGSSGNVEVITERPEQGASGRQSWRQVR